MEGFLLIVAIYVVLTVLGATQKKKRQERQLRERQLGLPLEGRGAEGPSSPGAGRPASGPSLLERALEELKRAEAEAGPARLPGPGRRTPAGFPPLQETAAAYDDEVFGDAEEGEEEIHEVEAIDLDEESVREVEERERAYGIWKPAPIAPVPARPSAVAATVARPAPLVPVPATPTPGAYRPAIVSTIVPSFGAPAGTAVPPDDEPARPAPHPRGLARFATGRLRDAVVLSEILRRPVGERM